MYDFFNRSIELLKCCCAGIENSNNNGDEEQLFRGSQYLQCRDNIFQHRRSKSCDFLDQLPSIIPLDSGYNICSCSLLIFFSICKFFFSFHRLSFEIAFTHVYNGGA